MVRKTLEIKQKRQLSSAWQLQHILKSLCLSVTPLWQLLAPYWRVLNSGNDKKDAAETTIVSRIWSSKASWQGWGSGCWREEGNNGRTDRKHSAGILPCFKCRGLPTKLDRGALETDFFLLWPHYRLFFTLFFRTTSIQYQGFWLPQDHPSNIFFFHFSQVVSERQLSTSQQKYNMPWCSSSWRVGKSRGVYCYAPSLRLQARFFTMNDKKVQSLAFLLCLF